MGPEKSSMLFQNAVGEQGVEARLADEIDRRLVLAEVLRDLSRGFADGLATTHPITEPVLPLKLYALASVQRTSMGVAGSDPTDVVRRSSDSSIPMIRAQVAPSHDSYMSDIANAAVQTRAIMFDLGRDEGEGDSESVHEFFGLNMFINDAWDDGVLAGVGVEPQTPSGIIIVNASGRLKVEESHITGETPVLAVRNRQTGDAKVYAVTELSDEVLKNIDYSERRQYEIGRARMVEDSVAHVMLPTGQILVVAVLNGPSRIQAADEFSAAVDAFKGSPTVKLSQAEFAAARDPHSSR